MHSLNLDYDTLDQSLLIKILQIADLMDVPPKVVMKTWLLNQCDESNDLLLDSLESQNQD